MRVGAATQMCWAGMQSSAPWMLRMQDEPQPWRCGWKKRQSWHWMVTDLVLVAKRRARATDRPVTIVPPDAPPVP